VSADAWNALDEATQTAVRTAARNSAITQRELWAAREAESRAKVEAAGSKVNEVENKVAFQERMAPVYEKFLAENPDLASVIEAIQATK
jgi:TRAP-type C4-dicarboxylate transport system substrate-binding protein